MRGLQVETLPFHEQVSSGCAFGIREKMSGELHPEPHGRESFAALDRWPVQTPAATMRQPFRQCLRNPRASIGGILRKELPQRPERLGGSIEDPSAGADPHQQPAAIACETADAFEADSRLFARDKISIHRCKRPANRIE